jgi:hypothetical protein
MAYPPAWRRIVGDRGTVSVARFDRRHRFLGYLNLTPRQGSETLTDWWRFRVEHNADEGDGNVQAQAEATGLRFQQARGSCVRDAYTRTIGARYEELACLVAGKHEAAVIIGASSANSWSRIAPLLEKAISTLRT